MAHLVDEDLERILKSEEYEDQGSAFLIGFRQDSRDLKLVFDIKLWNDGFPDSTWAITATNVLGAKLVLPDSYLYPRRN
jgi:hypothetical protein